MTPVTTAFVQKIAEGKTSYELSAGKSKTSDEKKHNTHTIHVVCFHPGAVQQTQDKQTQEKIAGIFFKLKCGFGHPPAGILLVVTLRRYS